MRKFYITTTLPYVNAAPHIGFALELVQADVIARYHRLLGEEVFFNTGTDEHGLKVYKVALTEGKEPQVYVDEYAEKFRNLAKILDVQYDNFIRTTDEHHKKAAQEFWRRCDKNGDIYKGKYKIKYCVGCELEKTDSELEDGRCPIHPNLELEIIEEENYFFRFSKYAEPLLKFYDEHPGFVLPEPKFNEIKNFVKSGLNDFSISRLKEKMPWGVAVPGDNEQVMYVWFDALINYISTLGWPFDATHGEPSYFEKFWGTKENPKAIQVAGKDQVRQQAAMWQAMLLSAGLPNSRQIIIHGFITSAGQKMSKSLGNVIDPFEVVEKYGTDALRYWLLREIPTFEDGDFTWKKFKERYNADLANGLGNFVARILTLYEKYQIPDDMRPDDWVKDEIQKTEEVLAKKMNEFKFNEVLAKIWELITRGDSYINEVKPWSPEEVQNKGAVLDLKTLLSSIAEFLQSVLPESSERINRAIREKNKGSNLFPRI